MRKPRACGRDKDGEEKAQGTKDCARLANSRRRELLEQIEIDAVAIIQIRGDDQLLALNMSEIGESWEKLQSGFALPDVQKGVSNSGTEFRYGCKSRAFRRCTIA